MAKVRAYKIAEELGLDREEFLKKAADMGIPLKSPMVAVDEEQVEQLRQRLGAKAPLEREEKRIGTTVIRRRRKAPPKPVEPEPPAPAELEVEAPAAPEPMVAGEAPGAEPIPGEEAPVPLVAEPAAPEPTPELQAEPVTLQPAASGEQPTAPAQAPPPPPAEAPLQAPAAKRLVRRQAIQGLQLREQESLARMLRGNVQTHLERRRQIVEQQSRIQSRRRRPVGGTPARKPPVLAEKKKVVKLEGPIAFQELSRRMGVKLHEIVRRAEALGTDTERTTLLDAETAGLVAADLGFEVQTVHREEPGAVVRVKAEQKDLLPRPPVVTVMGHVDHGKTSLLDTIRKTNVVAGEVGGITQHIGAYKVSAGNLEIAFIDTPGHEAFTQMRARGAQVTDIAILVVAADDGIMPQTVEALAHAKAAGVPIIVAINKIDLPDAQPERVKQALLEHELVPEDFGGDTICVEVSATKKTNIEKLLEMIGLQAEILELRSRYKGPAEGIVVEAQLDRGRGPLATVLVREGTLKRGDAIVAGTAYGRVRSLMNERGENIKDAGPATPVQVVGLCEVPEAGEELVVVKNERTASEVAAERVEDQQRSASATQAPTVTMDAEEAFATLGESEEKELRAVLRADVHGTMEAIRDSMEKLSTDKVKLKVIHSGVGAVTERDVMLSSASEAMIIGFRVRPEPAARKLAEQEEVEIRTYGIVYEVLDDMVRAMEGLLPPQVTERVMAHAEVRQLFPIQGLGTIAGCYVAEGTFLRSNPVRVIRDGVVVYKAPLASLRRFKDDVREVAPGLECGMAVQNFNDVKVGDLLESYIAEESPAKL
jgi:translation initiation factor IF-2